MYYKIIVVCFNIICVYGSGIFHENSKITFLPDAPSEFFGYSVVLNPYGLIVGAPKATSRAKPLLATGLVFNCTLEQLDVNNVTCYPVGPGSQTHAMSRFRRLVPDSFYKDDMWFGATVASITSGKLLYCAPRYTEPYSEQHLLANGVCYLQQKDRGKVVYPLQEYYGDRRHAFKTDGRRREYGEYGNNLNYYAYGQAGMSVKVTGNNSVIIGAPGLLQWTGGILNYLYYSNEHSTFFSRQPLANPYYTKDLGPDDYFGYSVDAGVFDPDGKTLYVGGAPRSKMGYGQVLIFEPTIREQDPLAVRASIRGPQLGAYFGASLCATDINGDGLIDLLVGAPNFARKNGDLPYDQGAVFIYLNKRSDSNFTLEASGYVSGSGESGARFGTVIADLGDLDGDGFNDVAISAPWENEDTGVVYIYRGYTKGLKSKYIQRILAEGASSFGISISKGLDVDRNNCNDLAIGAAKSSTVYIYRCVPTIQVQASINVPDAMNLPHNATGFTALFCVTAQSRPLWPHVRTNFKAKIIIDPEQNRAMISSDSEYKMSISPGNEQCDEHTVDVKPTADLSKPISIKLILEPDELLKNDSKHFNSHAARVSEDSALESTFLIQLLRDCGEDMICTPWLVMTLEALDNPYIPGTDTKLGARLTILNKEEPAYGAKVNITLPDVPKRVPSECSLDDLIMSCDVPAPLFRDEEISWEIELEYNLNKSDNREVVIETELEDRLYNRNISEESVQKLVIDITPQAVFNVSGKSLPNNTVTVSREKLYESENVTFTHYYEITNFGPSDWSYLKAHIYLPELVNLSIPVIGCTEQHAQLECVWSIPAKVSRPVVLPLRFELGRSGDTLRRNLTFNVTTEISLLLENGHMNSLITTTLILDPAPPIWPLILGIVSGLILLAAIVYILYRYGFFSRQQREKLKQLQDQTVPLVEDDAGCSTGSPSIANESTQELLHEDSD